MQKPKIACSKTYNFDDSYKFFKIVLIWRHNSTQIDDCLFEKNFTEVGFCKNLIHIKNLY